jgi:16S rRNA (guanine527-N7)-methyltransferase
MTRIRATLSALSLPASFEVQLAHFIELFQKWNRSINLSAARTEAELTEHIIDSLHVIPHLRTTATPAVLDVGAGGGLPSVIAAICVPDARITALEPVHKKHAFLRTAARELALPNLEARAERIDDHAAADYDLAMSRATFDLREWLLRGLAAVKPGGTVLGFEAVPRADLPPGTQRAPYSLDGKTRAIVSLRREPTR